MLSKNKVVKMQKIIEQLYDGKCTITGSQETTDEDGATIFETVVICENQPCRLSFGASKIQEGDSATEQTQEIKLFIAPDIVVPAGSRLTVVQNGVTQEYKLSGVSVTYPTHQEISFTLKDRWT